MTRSELVSEIKRKRSFLCVGLDPHPDKMPASLQNNLFEFNRRIIDATAPYAIAFKPNLAFYELQGAVGYQALADTVKYIKTHYPEQMVIADAKRGDIGNTSKAYAIAVFDELGADAITVAPYMGSDSVTPFLERKDKWVILLALTSNKGSRDFQLLPTEGNRLHFFEQVIKKSQEWTKNENLMYVIGATQGLMFKRIRQLAPSHFLLVPGIGAQGGSLDLVAKYGMTSDCGLIVNASRSIIHASGDENFAQVAAEKARDLQQQMEALLVEHKVCL